MGMIIAPDGTGHAGPDWIRILAPRTAAKKNNNNMSRHDDRNYFIRNAIKHGASIREVCFMYQLKYTTVCKIIGEQK